MVVTNLRAACYFFLGTVRYTRISIPIGVDIVVVLTLWVVVVTVVWTGGVNARTRTAPPRSTILTGGGMPFASLLGPHTAAVASSFRRHIFGLKDFVPVAVAVAAHTRRVPGK